MGPFAKAFRDDTKGATVDWAILSAGILLLGAVAVYEVFVGGANALVSEMNQNLANAPTTGKHAGPTSAGDGGSGDACAKQLEEGRAGAYSAECRSQEPLDE